ncbi:MAG TPA: nucleotidyltransferase family protein [Anaerolineaceae bacterium]|nr:nucleotidyltransferase family protein [Anaerolineaceae bacterium]
MDVIVTAGGMPRPDESLYALTQGGYKAMLDLHGKPMIQWVIDALTGAPSVEKIVVVGLPVFTDLVTDKPLTIIPDQGEMLANFKSGVDELLKTNPNLQQVLACSSDIPTITSEHVEWMIQRVLESDDDLYYNVIERSVMEARFSGSKRTYLRLKDVEVCGGDLNAIRASMVDEDNPLYHRLLDARKSTLRQAALLGYDTLLLLLTRQRTLADAARIASSRLHLSGRAILCPYAEMGMDVDKPHQLELVRADLARQKVA